ncbi:MAG: glycosyltransferase family 39 protein [Gemmatimonadetes bacterium]|nr:glycosyltransferase family 39 protein [Gemmatimonadota bacterium]
MTPQPQSPDQKIASRPVPGGTTLVVALVALRAVLPLATIDPAWEFHRDELLYSAMGDHFQPMAMQFPPLIAAVAAISKSVLGTSVWAARVPAALAGAALLGAMLLLIRRLGGGATAMAFAALASVAAPVLLRPSVLLQPVVFDQLFAFGAVAGVLLAAQERNPRWWLLTGLSLGLGALTKFSAAFYAVALIAPAVTVPDLRRQLLGRWPWLAALATLALAVPSLTGQITHGWPFLAQLGTLRSGQLDRIGPGEFLIEQPMLLGAALLPVLVGLGSARRSVAARVATSFALALLAVMIILGGKAYYAVPGYPALIAVGAIGLARARMPIRWLTAGAMATMAALVLPMGIPVLGPEAMARYAAKLGVTEAVRTNRGEVLALPQDYADMLGWRRMAEEVARVWQRLTPAEQADALLVGSNYGEAGALAMYHRELGLPYPVSTAGDFHAWGIGTRTGQVTLLIGRPDAGEALSRLFAKVEEVARIEDPRAVPEQRDLRVFVARGPKSSLADLWATLGPRWG